MHKYCILSMNTKDKTKQDIDKVTVNILTQE